MQTYLKKYFCENKYRGNEYFDFLYWINFSKEHLNYICY